MNTEPLISIIMPVYNTGELLRHTVDCIVKQTYPNWELILVDDGSTNENTIIICDELGKSDSRIKVFHKTNGGICDARNYGLDRARGTYIAFCDHDDDYLPDLLEQVSCEIVHSSPDVVKYSYRVIEDNDDFHDCMITNQYERIVDVSPSVIMDLIYRNALATIWSSVYKASIIRENHILFDTNYRRGGEDFDFNMRIMSYTHKYSLIPEILYFHYFRESLSTSAKVYEERLQIFIDEIKRIYNVYSVSSQNANISSMYSEIFLTRLIGYVSYAIKLKKSRSEIIRQLSLIKCFFPSCHFKNVNKSSKKTHFVYFLYKKEVYNIIYYVLKLNLYIKNIFH